MLVGNWPAGSVRISVLPGVLLYEGESASRLPWLIVIAIELLAVEESMEA